MAWGKNGTPNTLSGTADDCDITDLTANKLNVFLHHKIASGAVNQRLSFNNDSNSVYAARYSANGGTDGTLTSQTYLQTNHYSTDSFTFSYVCSVSGEEKLMMWWKCNQNSAGAANAPNRVEMVMKYVPSPDADITRIDMNNNAAGDYAAGTNASALGSELTPASATTIETGSIYIDTDTNQRYFWNGSSWSLQA